jgi:hypothetical protein
LRPFIIAFSRWFSRTCYIQRSPTVTFQTR